MIRLDDIGGGTCERVPDGVCSLVAGMIRFECDRARRRHVTQRGWFHGVIVAGLFFRGGSLAVSMCAVGMVTSTNWSSVSICRALTKMFCRLGWRRATNLGEVKCNVW